MTLTDKTGQSAHKRVCCKSTTQQTGTVELIAWNSICWPTYLVRGHNANIHEVGYMYVVIYMYSWIQYSGKFSLVQIFAEKRPDFSEEIFVVFIFTDAGRSGHTPTS